MQRRVFHTAFILTKDKPTSEAFADEVSMQKEERDQIAALSEAVCQQYSLMGQHAPAILLGVHVVAYGSKVALTLNKLEEIARFNARHQRKDAPAPAEKEAA
jgi:hypothetical protein